MRRALILALAALGLPLCVRADDQPPTEAERGAVLVKETGCAGCHTAPGGRPMGGGQVVDGADGPYAVPNITGGRQGLAGWSAGDVAEYLGTGRNRFAAASGPMAAVVTGITAAMPNADLVAIATYLKGLPGDAPTAQPLPADDPRMVAGRAIYAGTCSGCHMMSGAGVPRLIPALAGLGTVDTAAPDTVVRVVLRGAKAVATDRAPTGPAMPSFAWRLDDEQVAAVATYVRNSWGNAAPPVASETVVGLRRAFARP